MRRIRRFIDESWSELKKVSWPTRTTVRTLTVLVIVVTLAVGVFISGVDLVFSEVVKLVSSAA